MGIITIKTKYGKKLDSVYLMLCEGRKRMASLKSSDGYHGLDMRIKFPYQSKPELYWVTRIGCNSFGIEVEVGGSWQAIEQLSEGQQSRIIKAIDWSTLE